MFTLTWITEKELERVIENKGDEFRRKNMQICFLLTGRKSVLDVQFVYLLIRSISLKAIFIAVPV